MKHLQFIVQRAKTLSPSEDTTSSDIARRVVRKATKRVKRKKIESIIEATHDGEQIKDFEYLIHHIEIKKDGTEEIHHCFLYDHIANLFEQGHLVIKGGKASLDGKALKDGTFHVIVGLEKSQEVVYSDEEAIKAGIKPKAMKAGMKGKQKAKEW